MKYIIGIDPGKAGGIAILSLDGRELKYIPMAEGFELADFLDEFKLMHEIVRVYIEKSQSMTGNSAKSMFTYGVGFGKILGVLETLKISYDLIPPLKWQRKMIPGCKKGETKKTAYIKAKQLYPHETFVLAGCRTFHDGIVDAVLIAEYGRGLHFVSLEKVKDRTLKA